MGAPSSAPAPADPLGSAPFEYGAGSPRETVELGSVRVLAGMLRPPPPPWVPAFAGSRVSWSSGSLERAPMVGPAAPLRTGSVTRADR